MFMFVVTFLPYLVVLLGLINHKKNVPILLQHIVLHAFKLLPFA
jgi:hypothetical protein